MPRTNRPAAYRLHKARNCAVVTIHGRNHYLGPFGSSESHEQYARLITQWRATDHLAAAESVLVSNGDLTINAIIRQHLIFAAGYYLSRDRFGSRCC